MICKHCIPSSTTLHSRLLPLNSSMNMKQAIVQCTQTRTKVILKLLVKIVACVTAVKYTHNPLNVVFLFHSFISLAYSKHHHY